jgi:cytochrome c oxidase cbb3-type subunit 4
MDIDAIRSLMTVTAFITFAAIVLWAYSARARRGFDEAERLPFEEDGADERVDASRAERQ